MLRDPGETVQSRRRSELKIDVGVDAKRCRDTPTNKNKDAQIHRLGCIFIVCLDTHEVRCCDYALNLVGAVIAPSTTKSPGEQLMIIIIILLLLLASLSFSPIDSITSAQMGDSGAQLEGSQDQKQSPPSSALNNKLTHHSPVSLRRSFSACFTLPDRRPS